MDAPVAARFEVQAYQPAIAKRGHGLQNIYALSDDRDRGAEATPAFAPSVGPELLGPFDGDDFVAFCAGTNVVGIHYCSAADKVQIACEGVIGVFLADPVPFERATGLWADDNASCSDFCEPGGCGFSFFCGGGERVGDEVHAFLIVAEGLLEMGVFLGNAFVPSGALHWFHPRVWVYPSYK
jgi:hypothetical protein